jgi:hypothetical protein
VEGMGSGASLNEVGHPGRPDGRSVPASGKEMKHHYHLVDHLPPCPHDGTDPTAPSRHRGDPRPRHRRLRRRKGDGELQLNPGQGPGGRAGAGVQRHGNLPASRTLPVAGVLSQRFAGTGTSSLHTEKNLRLIDRGAGARPTSPFTAWATSTLDLPLRRSSSLPITAGRMEDGA